MNSAAHFLYSYGFVPPATSTRRTGSSCSGGSDSSSGSGSDSDTVNGAAADGIGCEDEARASQPPISESERANEGGNVGSLSLSLPRKITAPILLAALQHESEDQSVKEDGSAAPVGSSSIMQLAKQAGIAITGGCPVHCDGISQTFLQLLRLVTTSHEERCDLAATSNFIGEKLNKMLSTRNEIEAMKLLIRVIDEGSFFLLH